MAYTENYRGFNINIMIDDSPQSPRQWDNLGDMICWHSLYNLGDMNLRQAGFDDVNELREFLDSKEVYAWLPLYLYDHSGITMNTNGFDCNFDSGLVGFIMVTDKKIKEEFGIKEIPSKEEINKHLNQEVIEYDQFITGQVYGYEIEGQGLDDSCWGFYGDEGISDAIAQAKGAIDWHFEQEQKFAWEKHTQENFEMSMM